MTIKQVTVQNYQSHKKTVLNLHSGVNALIGVSDCGKSAFMRALIWPIRNKNDDRGFRSRWGGKCDVEITFEDGKVVSRVQDKDNAYYLYDPASNVDEEYKAFKTDIPEDITTALNMSDINIQSQFDRPFLLDDSAGDVAKLFNKITNLTDIDTSISNIRKLILANSKELNTTEAMIADLTEQEKGFAYLDQMEKDVDEYEKLYSGLEVLDSNISNLVAIIDRYEQSKKEQDEITTFLKAEEGLTLALTLVEEEKAVVSQILALNNLLTTIANNQHDIDEANSILPAESDLNNALQLVEELRIVQQEGEKLTLLLNKIRDNEILVAGAKINLERKEELYAELMPSTCPLCERSIN